MRGRCSRDVKWRGILAVLYDWEQDEQPQAQSELESESWC